MRRFHLSIESTIIIVLACSTCYSLSYWQYSRYKGKLAYLDLVERQDQRGRMPLPEDPGDWEPFHLALVSLEGEFDSEHDCVIINRSKDDRPGVKLITPLRLKGRDETILVDRGFIPYADSDPKVRSKYAVSGTVRLEGRLKPSQDPQFFFAVPQKAPSDGGWKDRWHRLDIPAMAAQLDSSVLPVYLEQTNQTTRYPAFLERAVVSPLRHLNYTIQWASFGTFALGLGIFLQFRRSKHRQPAQ